MISLRHIYKTYSANFNALRDVTFDIQKGEFVFLTGPSGAGKTTLFKLLSCYERATSGGITVAGYQLNTIKKDALPLFRRRIGVVYQDFRLLKDRTVFENVALPLLVQGQSRGFIEESVTKVLNQVSLRFKAQKYPMELSGGEQQRVAIARAIVHKPEILIADEPTGNLDPELSRDIIQIFDEVNAQGTTLLIATHDKSMVETKKKREIRLHSGCLTDLN